MKEFKLIHVADLGFRNLPYGGINPETGLNRRLEDVKRNFAHVKTIAIQEKVKYFVIAGDINEERNPESILIELFSEEIADLIAEDIKVIIIAGNHDVDSAKGTSTSISYIKALGLVDTYVADIHPDTFEFEDAVFHCVPTMYPESVSLTDSTKCLKDNDDLTDHINRNINLYQLREDKANILVAHYSLENTFAGLGVDEPVLKIDTLTKFDYVALGHIHKYEMFSSFKGGYTGSLFVKDFGEEFEKFFNLVTFKLPDKKSSSVKVDIKKYPIPERRFVEFKIDASDMDAENFLKAIEKQVINVKDAVVKIKVTSTRRFNPKPVYEHLRKQGVFHHAPIEWNIIRQDNTVALDVKHGMTDNDIVRSFLEDKEIGVEFKEKVEKYTSGIINNWQEEIGAGL